MARTPARPVGAEFGSRPPGRLPTLPSATHRKAWLFFLQKTGASQGPPRSGQIRFAGIHHIGVREHVDERRRTGLERPRKRRLEVLWRPDELAVAAQCLDHLVIARL